MSLEFPDFTLKFDTFSKQFYWIGFKSFSDKKYFLKIVYPHEFPSIQPSVYVSEDESFSNLLTFENSIHRLKNGSICLFPWDFGQYGWKTYYSVVDVINKFLDFVDLFNKKEIPQDHFSSPSEGFIKVPTAIILSLKDQSDFHSYHRGIFHAIFDPSTNSYIVQKITFLSDHLATKETVLFNYFSFFPLAQLYWFVVSNSTLNEITQLYTKDELESFLVTKFKNWTLTNFQQPLCFIAYNKTTHTFRTHCIANALNIPRLEIVKFYFGNISEESVQRTKDVLNINMHQFDNYMLCFVGAGSLGSEISLQMVKAGFKYISLVDPDFLEPVNLSRHILDIRSLHRNKAQALAMTLASKIFDVKATAYAISILAPGVLDGIIDLAKRDHKKLILICTTNDLESEYFVNTVAVRENITCFFSSCSINVEMGRIFRVIPTKTPCYNCISLEREQDTSKLTFPESGDKWDLAPYSQGIPGIGLDVSIIGDFTAKLILETILDEINPLHNYKTVQSDHVIISLSNTNKNSLGVFVQNFIKNPSCSICSTNIPNENYMNEVNKLKLAN